MKIISLVLFSMLFEIAIAQKSNTLYLEIGGRSFYGSVTYDKLIKKIGKSNLGVSIGFGAIPTETFQTWAIPASLNFITHADKSHHLELGIGLTYQLVREKYLELTSVEKWENKQFYYLNSTIGYRYQQINGGLFFKLNINVMSGIYGYAERNGKVNLDNKYSGWFKSTGLYPIPVMPWGGIGIGYTF